MLPLLWVAFSAAAPCVPQDLPAGLGTASQLLEEGEAERVLEQTGLLYAALPCSPVTNPELGRLLHLASAASWMLGRQAEAESYLRRALLLAPSVPVEARLGGPLLEMEQRLKAEVQRQPSARLDLSGAAWLDGRALEAGSYQVLPGEHLLQEGEPLSGRWLKLEAPVQSDPVLSSPPPVARKTGRASRSLAIAGVATGVVAIGATVLQGVTYEQFYQTEDVGERQTLMDVNHASIVSLGVFGAASGGLLLSAVFVGRW